MPGARLPLPILRRLVNPERHVSDAALRAVVEGRTVLVTGASHGIGRATCERLAGAGAELLMVARSADTLAELAAALGPTARALPCDLADLEQVRRLVADIGDAEVEFVVSNAGKSIRRSVADSADRFDDVSRTTAVNYLAPVALLLALLPAMRARGRGHIVNVSTIGLLLPPAPRWSAYISSKAAFDVWLRSAVAETADDGVTASSIYMTLVHTRMSAPTRDFDRVPGLTPAQAADIVCHAIVERPAVVAPWWGGAAGALSHLARGPSDSLMRRYGRRVGARSRPGGVPA
ncbi:MAG TPA: SDR family NAD(P)-dependent oxidoreductase [Solirubrobacteraceae bacterium]|jgi:NAD(P)-dependent dehydrogenase (short-subunit alcohol dehydrogenase family)|nr:SDR family NAD(P)-dependent oxidoreductase [Solirubrobacteraceae bacterium]